MGLPAAVTIPSLTVALEFIDQRPEAEAYDQVKLAILKWNDSPWCVPIESLRRSVDVMAKHHRSGHPSLTWARYTLGIALMAAGEHEASSQDLRTTLDDCRLAQNTDLEGQTLVALIQLAKLREDSLSLAQLRLELSQLPPPTSYVWPQIEWLTQ